jgi:hypothetical protein
MKHDSRQKGQKRDEKTAHVILPVRSWCLGR